MKERDLPNILDNYCCDLIDWACEQGLERYSRGNVPANRCIRPRLAEPALTGKSVPVSCASSGRPLRPLFESDGNSVPHQ